MISAIVCSVVAVILYLNSYTNVAILAGFAAGYSLAAAIIGRNAPPMSTRRKLMMATWSAPAEGNVFGVITCNADPLVAYLEELKKQKKSVSVTTVILRAIGIAYREAPAINCSIAFGQFIPNKSIDISCLVALDDGADLAMAKITDIDHKSLDTIQDELKKKAEKLRAHKDEDFEKSKPLLALLPVPVLTVLVNVVGYLASALGLNIPALGVRPHPFGSCMVTSVGMLGVEQAFVPFTPFARVPFLMTVGAINKKPIVNEANQIAIQQQITLTATLDHRFADGTQAARMAKKLKYLVEHPKEMEKMQ